MKLSRKLNAFQRDACSKRVGPHDEQRIKTLVAEGKTNSAIAAALGFSRVTIQKARARIGIAAAKPGRPSVL